MPHDFAHLVGSLLLLLWETTGKLAAQFEVEVCYCCYCCCYWDVKVELLLVLFGRGSMTAASLLSPDCLPLAACCLLTASPDGGGGGGGICCCLCRWR
jgi:hypothetical protein